MSRYLSAPDATSLPTSLPQEQVAKTKILSSGMDPAKGGVFSIMQSYFETFGKYLLITKYPTSTNMPTAHQKKGHNIFKRLYCICHN